MIKKRKKLIIPEVEPIKPLSKKSIDPFLITAIITLIALISIWIIYYNQTF